MTQELSVEFTNIPKAWAGFLARYRIMNESMDTLNEGSMFMNWGDSKTYVACDNDLLSDGKYIFSLKLPSGQQLSSSFVVERGLETIIKMPSLNAQKLVNRAVSFPHQDPFKTMLIKAAGVNLANLKLDTPRLRLDVYIPRASGETIELTTVDAIESDEMQPGHYIFKLKKSEPDVPRIAKLTSNSNKSSMMVVLPTNSIEANEGNSIDCTFAMESNATLADMVVAVTMPNRSAQSLLSFMRAADIDSAQAVSENVIFQAHTMFEQKDHDVAAACAAAYFLIATGDWKNLPVEWCENLHTRFQYIADGSVIFGHRLAAELPEEPNFRSLKKIGLALIEGSKRGLPMFSAGMRILADDMLALLNSMADCPEAESEFQLNLQQAYLTVASRLRYCKFTRSFTALTFDKPEMEQKIFIETRDYEFQQNLNTFTG